MIQEDNAPLIKTLGEAQPPPNVDQVDSSTTYIGWSSIGTDELAAEWKIAKIITSGTVTKTLWADGNQQYDNIWANRLTLNYSR